MKTSLPKMSDILAVQEGELLAAGFSPCVTISVVDSLISKLRRGDAS